MKTKELLLECKIALKINSDYALGKALDIPRARISDYMAGRSNPNEYAAFRIAEVLKRDPALIIAQLQMEKSEKHREYWQNFIQQHSKLASVLGCVVLSSSIFYAPELQAANSGFISQNERLRQTRWRKYSPKNDQNRLEAVFLRQSI